MNSKNTKEKFADTVLKLEESVQGTLMQMLEKYIAKDAPETPTGGIEKEFVESLVVQLKQKDIERDTMIDYVSKIEHENEELSERIAEIERTYKELMAERQREKVEFEEYKAGTGVVKGSDGRGRDFEAAEGEVHGGGDRVPRQRTQGGKSRR